MTREMKSCRECGAAFETSRTGKTVRCQACRKARAERRNAASSFDAYAEAYVAMGEARQRGHAAQAAGDDEAYAQAVADFTYWSERARRAG